MLILIKNFFKITFFILLVISINTYVYADESEGNDKTNYSNYDYTQDKNLLAKNIHSQLYTIYKSNQNLRTRLSAKNESLNNILLTLKSLNDKLEFKIKSKSTVVSNNNVTLSDFSSKNDDLIRKCDEIVDNYYSRKSQQEKNYVQQLYNTEQNDPQWELEIEDQLQNFIGNNNLSQSELFAVNCKSSVCQMRVQHKSSEASQQFRNKLRNDSNWQVYNSENKSDRVTGGVITNVTLLRDKKQVREFVWGK